jgi:hypothetical protein
VMWDLTSEILPFLSESVTFNSDWYHCLNLFMILTPEISSEINPSNYLRWHSPKTRIDKSITAGKRNRSPISECKWHRWIYQWKMKTIFSSPKISRICWNDLWLIWILQETPEECSKMDAVQQVVMVFVHRFRLISFDFEIFGYGFRVAG